MTADALSTREAAIREAGWDPCRTRNPDGRVLLEALKGDAGLLITYLPGRAHPYGYYILYLAPSRPLPRWHKVTTGLFWHFAQNGTAHGYSGGRLRGKGSLCTCRKLHFPTRCYAQQALERFNARQATEGRPEAERVRRVYRCDDDVRRWHHTRKK